MLRKPHHFFAGALFAIFAVLLANYPSYIFVNKITTMLGKISFSMYMTHFAILRYSSRFGLCDIFPKSNLSSLLFFTLVVLATAVVSFFCYKFIEKNGMQLGKYLIERRELVRKGE